jgi:drug/metabolite transporter (DMT)-like permease
MALVHWHWYTGIARAQGSVATAFMGLMPPAALVLSYLLLGERSEWIPLIGFGTVFAKILLIS